MPQAELSGEDRRWLAAAAALAERARPLSRPNPGVGAIILRDGKVAGRGWTQPGGRPHAEAMALAEAGDGAKGATLYVTLEPCAHRSPRGPSCSDLVAVAGVARAVIGMQDPDPRTAGAGLARLADEGLKTVDAGLGSAELGLEGHTMHVLEGRPHVTLKLALSLDGCIATASGESQWITGEITRRHVHRERARADAILVGGETLRHDTPRLDVRLPALAERSPERWVLSRSDAPDGWARLTSPGAIRDMTDIRYLFVEGGAAAAAAFLSEDMVDCLLLYRAPILLGDGRPGLADIGLEDLSSAHRRWTRKDLRVLGQDTLEILGRTR
ncbi:bifunctional diaminohydroxyphosphoribosylaminopyrimidine deaminase/5-amino-6-(5-phosphoribosylamino)uracil reductase RibD [Aurantiacibacter aquimixticola]|uniref:bifunctional diaminohydroxyphosphoribosylaminopyrimidine deaminase/5-amino-6-(5-phosphoribosylamino)uracil reductase RibD n=1 Tax=Aurantiacibacter aquimixticola TaxID=1958945 RepID=UPI001F5BB490|nr:bifunctional diaminohydroxyphosphoribosylaminopyrimidine deaminase/5-amino-6-(5-phosphoribosylamino)uracil reductase RibD [Aurantiacibacter aquimixticola]